MKKVAILQSNYIPWKGYFDLIAEVDEFIFYDDMQYTKNDWRNRNKIKTPQGLQWLTIPAGQDISRRIRDVVVDDSRWQAKHWKTLEANYGRAAHFEEISSWLAPLYLDHPHRSLSEFNRLLIAAICRYLNITTKLSVSWDYVLSSGKTERLVDLCVQAGATEYVSGPAARNYLQPALFLAQGITVTWFQYIDYPEYRQIWEGFEHRVTILDLLFNCGSDSGKYMRCGDSRNGT